MRECKDRALSNERNTVGSNPTSVPSYKEFEMITIDKDYITLEGANLLTFTNVSDSIRVCIKDSSQDLYLSTWLKDIDLKVLIAWLSKQKISVEE